MRLKSFNYNKVYEFLLMAIAVSIPFIEYFKTKYSSILLILLFIWWLISFNFKVKFARLLSQKIIFLFLLLYLTNFHGLFIPVENNIGEKVLLKKAALFLFPLIIGTGPPLEFKLVKKIIFFFIASLVLSTFVTFSKGVEQLVLSPEGLTDLAEKITIHRPLFGLFCAFSILALLSFINRKSTYYGVALCLIISIYLLFFILFIYAKMTFIALVLTVILLLIIWLFHKRKLALLSIILFAGLLSVVGVYKLNPAVNNFINNIKASNNFSYTDHNILVVGSINVRYINWGCAIQILKENNNWVYGVGAGNAQAQLQECYKDINPWIYENKMNSHNQYLEEALYNGIIGLCILLACILIPATIAYKQSNFIYIGFVLIFAFCCLTENILSRGIGIIFYSFFNSILFFNPKKVILKS